MSLDYLFPLPRDQATSFLYLEGLNPIYYSLFLRSYNPVGINLTA